MRKEVPIWQGMALDRILHPLNKQYFGFVKCKNLIVWLADYIESQGKIG